MTQRADTPVLEIENLLRQLAGGTDRSQSVRATTTLRILAMTEWSARIVSVCVAALTGVALTLTFVSGAETTARANPAIAEHANRLAKTGPLLSRHDPASRGHSQPFAPPLTIDVPPGARFAFIRGGIDDTMLTWMPAKQPMIDTPAVQTRRKPHQLRRPPPKTPVRTAETAVRQPWLLDVIIRHIARGS
jgi:hypothetical protein